HESCPRSGERGARALPRSDRGTDSPKVRSGIRGAQLWTNGHDSRRSLERRCGVPGHRARASTARGRPRSNRRTVVRKPKRGLRRGLGALTPTEDPRGPGQDRPSDVFFSKSESPADGTSRAARDHELIPVPGAQFAHIDPQSVVPNPRQPRTNFDEEAMAELIGSVKEIGVLQP